MKALFYIMLLAIATTAIAGPLSKQAKTKLLLAALQDDAEIEGWLSNIGNAIKEYGPGILKTGLKLADYVVTEAGFGADLGAIFVLFTTDFNLNRTPNGVDQRNYVLPNLLF